MRSNSTGMDVFDRSFEPMCYCVSSSDNDMSSLKKVMGAWNNVGFLNATSAMELKKGIPQSWWHIRRSDLLTLAPIVLKRNDGRRVEPLYYGGRVYEN